jgi:hypothetical protein
MTRAIEVLSMAGCSLHFHGDGVWTIKLSDETSYTFGKHLPFTKEQALDIFYLDVEDMQSRVNG